MKSPRILILAVCLGISFIAAGCTAPAPQEDYPEPNYLDYATNQRRDFVEAFLQGRWCEAENLLSLSTENYLQLDRFCEAAYNYLLSWRLKAYIGADDPKALNKAKEMRELGKGCPNYDRLVFPQDGIQPSGSAPVKDSDYRGLLAAKDFQTLYDKLITEDNELYASVYARKAARESLDSNQDQWTDRFLDIAQAVDSEHGWVVFLRQDWLLRRETAQSAEEKETIAERIKYLDDFITPCE